MEETIYIPADIPNASINEYVNNYDEITLGSGRIMLFAGDQKIEHLNKDFYGEGISEDDNEPEHLFKIANTAEIGARQIQDGGYHHLQALLDESPEQIDALPISGLKTDTLLAQRQLLKQQCAQLSELGIWQSQLNLKEVLFSNKRPEAFNSQTWQRLQELCQPLLLVFNKNALARIQLKQLLS